MSRQRTPRAEPTVLHTMPEAAQRLGCSEMHVYRLIASGELAAVDISRQGANKSKTRIRSDELDAYIYARTRRADPAGRNPAPAA
jgi:excisionase family DNA binding protein